MKNIVPVLAAISALAIATPAFAQIVNGTNGVGGAPEAPIGTKAGGSSETMHAPGEAAAVAGAKQNSRDFKAGQMTTGAHAHTRASANSPTSGQ